MSISRRTATTVRIIGVASAGAALALGVAGNAFACNANDFTDSAACNTANGNATLTFTDHNDNTPLTVQVYLGSSKHGQQLGETLNLNGNAPHTGTIEVPWQTAKSWTAVVKPKNIASFNLTVAAPTGDCSVPTTPPTVAPTTAPPTTAPPTVAPTTAAPTPSESASVPPSVAPTSAAPSASASSSAPTQVDATSSESPAPGTALASTGGGSGTGMIAGIAAVLVAAGGGAVFFMRRRTAGARA